MQETTEPRRSLRRALVGGVAIAGVMLSTLVGVSAPAQAADATVSVPNTGTVGVQFNVVVSAPADAVNGDVSIQVFNNGNAVGFASGGKMQPIPGGATFTTPYTPAQNGNFNFVATVTVDGNTAYTANNSTNVASVTTTTSVNAPNTVALNQPVNLVATVAPTQGSFQPRGTVQFAIQGGANIGGPVQLNGGTPSTATVSWTPTSLGSVNIVATYSPASSGGITPAVCNNACTSAPDNVVVTSTGNAVGLSVPNLFVGVPSTLVATVFIPSYAGSVVFTVNGSAIGAAAPVTAASVGTAGVASVVYTPAAVGNVTLAATWTGNNGQTGTTSQTATVQTATGPDIVTIDPNGDPAPWSSSAPNLTPPGNYVLGVKTASGSAATLTISGAGCALAGNTVTVTGTSGSCVLNAKTAGGNGFSPGNSNFTLALTNGVQTAALAMPSSRRVPKGRTITLATPSQGETNAGQEISFRVTAGRNNCRLVYPASGAVRMRKTGSGRCTVVGTAPATGNYSPFSISRTYR